VGTSKRERQKANRQARLEQLAREARVRKTKKVGMRATLLVLAVVGVVAAVYFSSNDNGALESASSTSVGSATEATTPPTCATPSSVPDSTSAPATTIAYVKPTVQLPAALPTELSVTTLKEGSGPEAKVCDSVKVHYLGVLSADGTEFDNSYDRGTPFDVTLGLNTVIQGWEQGLVGVQAGGQYQLDFPAELGYGESGSGEVIKPGDALTFIVDVVSITPGEQSSASTDTTVPTESTVAASDVTTTTAG
jgi:peptidylprolyl isomerase